ncbi:CDP-glycerol glycerophosphotransferase family protein [Vibrio parahaemolyticus]|uniref:CDP-glycerol glycerophosphotransferase family protein n=1 Tax=Vibrio parahaemolyticus TaxID=670 RepID=UPI001DC053D6|nr:CDP-glycerol glycerophosphotransferase family protein [Vibrio parahaemolyticus]EHU5190398.1 CDP-glycerol glycerophosphotransferase family protein [Vibrio parahaemolyticus]EJG1504250.1 CDP-glycerol glycerophosphotransferase family protein [Vibrio parahaemolyticus]MCS0067377.1 CDP-glycerol glycerophosphotransferase family protein [Vibrio parahaemolyticus]MCS0259715.1 CDP-glycerol glycerophosphotransferase family protein [Vibrio parahaemolyticus]
MSKAKAKAKAKIKEIALFVIKIINFLVPKNKNRILFKSIPDFSGNCKALFDYLYSNHPHFDLVWAVSASDLKMGSYSGTNKMVTFGTIKFYYYYLTSGTIVTSHNELVSTSVSNQNYLSLWHGMPFKKICYLSPYDYQGMKDISVFRIATSELTRAIISASFREKANKVVITGQPRNDFLFEKKDIVESRWNISKYNQVLSYIPTFRENQADSRNIDGRYSDGLAINDVNFLRVSDFDLKEVNRYLEINNYLLLVKLHPFEELSLKDKYLGKNIKIVDSKFMMDNHLDVNHLLAFTDLLISDYSSVYFDFLILDRPIVFLVPDLNTYALSRGGFTLEPFEYWTPGAKVHSQRSLLSAVDGSFSDNDKFSTKRSEVSMLINKYNDNSNSRRVFDAFLKGGVSED